MKVKANSRQLSSQECKILEGQAYDKLVEKHKINDVLGDQVFMILRQCSRLLFYPLQDTDVWGFFEQIQGSTFVCINTTIPIDKQVFVAAHELYHIWYNKPSELISAGDVEETSKDLSLEELKANRFAAEFLVPRQLLKMEIQRLVAHNRGWHVQDIVKLARLFLVPYRTMVKRFYEIGEIDASQRDELLTINDAQIAVWRKRLGLELDEPSGMISLDDLIDKSMAAFEKGLITREKLEYLLSLAKTTPEELGLPPEVESIHMSDEELNAILEE